MFSETFSGITLAGGGVFFCSKMFLPAALHYSALI